MIDGNHSPRVLDDIPRDRQLPHLASLFNSRAMKQRLQERLFSTTDDRHPWIIQRCVVMQVHYTPESSCLIHYRLTVEQPATGAKAEHLLYGCAFPVGRSHAPWRTAYARELVSSRFGPALIHLPDVAMILWSFPNDRTLHTLPAVIEAAHHTPEFLRDWVASDLGSEWHIVKTTTQVVHYVGEQTCTVRTSIVCAHPEDPVHHTRTVFGTTYAKDAGTRTAHVMGQLWNSASRRNGQFSVSQPLWYDAGLKTLWHRGTHGTMLDSQPIEYLTSTPVLMKVAHAVAAFHSTSLTHLRARTKANLMRRLETVGSLLLQCQPACRAVLLPLLVRLTAQAKMIPVRPTATLHGRLCPDSLVLGKGMITVINLEHVCKGHPGQDLGSFIAGLLTWGVARQASLSQIARHAQIFLDQYHQEVPWKVGQPVVAWFIALALVTEHAYRCVTCLTSGRRGMVDTLLTLADDIAKTRSLNSLAFGRTEMRRGHVTKRSPL
mgnify:CR=1 FL=1